MLGRVVVENGVKKIVPLTADCGSGNPVGTVIAVYSNKVPNGYLPCNGVAFDTAQFPVLYALLGDNHTPDLRECTLKGIGESGRTVGAHVKAGGLAVGEFIDDRVQDLSVRLRVGTGSQGDALAMTGSTTDYENQLHNITTLGARIGDTTEVKAVGVNWCIKATSGINENQADNVLSALSPVDTVTSGDMHSVTSNAVAKKLGYKFLIEAGNSATEIEIETTQNITDFNYLIFIIRWDVRPYIYDTRILPTGIFRTVNRQILVQNIDGARARFRYVDDTHIKCRMQNAVNDPYYEVIGIL